MANRHEENIDTAKELEGLDTLIPRPKKLYSDIVKGNRESSTWIKENMKRSKGEKNVREITKMQKFRENESVCKERDNCKF